MVRGPHRWNSWVRGVTAMLGVLACVVFLGGCDVLEETVCDVVSVEDAETGDLIGELVIRGFEDIEGLFGDDD